MKKFFTFFAVIAFSFVSMVAVAQTKAPVWEPLKNFHGIMAATFHPAEEGDLAPLKKMSGDLLASAQTWQKAPVPMNYKEKETRSALKELVEQTKKINKAVAKKASDKDLTVMITDAHEIFHKIVGECKKSEEEMDGHKDHKDASSKKDEHEGHNHD